MICIGKTKCTCKPKRSISVAPFLPSQPWYTTEDRPQHRELRTLLLATSVWVLLRPTELLTLKGCETGPPAYRPYVMHSGKKCMVNSRICHTLHKLPQIQIMLLLACFARSTAETCAQNNNYWLYKCLSSSLTSIFQCYFPDAIIKLLDIFFIL